MTAFSVIWLRRVMAPALLCLTLIASVRATAQKADNEYVLAPGDVIDISVLNHTDLDKTVTILPDGKIAFAAVGEIIATGKTPKKLAAELYEILDKTLNNFAVTVTVKEPRARKVRIIGAVKTTGAFDFKDGTRLLDVIASAGGLSNKPSRITGRVIRGSLKVLPIDVEAAVAKPDTVANTLLEVDDLILLDEPEVAKPQIFAMGQIAKPGAFDLDLSTTILSLLAQAGGGTEKAAYSRAYVLRGRQQIPMNLRPHVIEGKPDSLVSGFRLQSGDILFLPENEARVAVMGQVMKPGFYMLPEDRPLTVLDALNLAGVQPQGANAGRAGIIRKNSTGKPMVIPVNVDKLFKKADLSINVQLQPDDVLYVPEKGKSLGLQDLYMGGGILNFLGFRLFR